MIRWRFYPDWVWPVPGSNRITSPYGWRTIDGQQQFHHGTDIGRYSASDYSSINWDYEILATRDGTIVNDTTFQDSSCGWWVRIDHGTINGDDVETLYCYLESQPLVDQDDSVDAGDRLGWMGNTGNSSAKHLHFGGYFDGSSEDMENYLTRPGIDVIDDYWDNHPQYQ